MKKIVLAITLLVGCLSLQAQQEAMYSHYSLNSMAYNPAYAGSRDAFSAVLLNRVQWAGFEGAPVTQYVGIHAPLFTESLGIGVGVINDNTGAINTIIPALNLSYALKINSNVKLRFGLKTSLRSRSGNLSSLELSDSNDDAFKGTSINETNVNFGAGAMLVGNDWYAGFAAPSLINKEYESTLTDVGYVRHYYLHGGKMFDLNSSWELSLSALAKLVEASPFSADITSMFIYDEKLELGAMFRSGDSFGALLGYTFGQQLRVGYAYDFSYSNSTAKYNGGSHEIMLRYDLVRSESGIVSPRFF